MDIKIEWQFPKVEVTRIGGLDNVIRSVQFRIIGRLGQRVAFREGSFILDDPNPDMFVQLNEITNDLMVQWVSVRFEESTTAHLNSIKFELQDEVEEIIPPFAV